MGDRGQGDPGRRRLSAADVEKLVYELAGHVGVDPRRLTLRRLMWMAEARSRGRWDHTAHMLAMLANTRFGAKESLSPRQFHPFYARAEQAEKLSPKESVALLARLFGRK